MNKELYENIKNELNSLEGELCAPSYVGGHFLGQKLEGKSGKDLFTVIYAFYEYMSQRKEFDFIREGGWAAFYRNNLSNYLTKDVIQSDFDEIISNDKLLDTILKVCNDDVKKSLYTNARVENSLHMKTGSDKYLLIYQKIEDSMVASGLIEKEKKPYKEVVTSGDATSAEIDKKIAELKQQELDLRTQKQQRRDVIFNEASNSIGINPEKLIKRVGKDESLGIDRIVIDETLVSMLAANSAIAATTPRNVFEKIRQKIKSSKHFKNINLEIDEIDGKKTLKVNKKETVFDKIANSENALVRAIANSAKRKLELFKSLVKPSGEVKAAVSQMLLNTSKKFANMVSKTREEIKTAYGEARENVRDAYVDFKADANKRIDAFKNQISDYGVQAREKISEQLYNMADKIAPNDVIMTSDGKVIMKSATKVGEMPAIEQEESLKKM